MSTRRYTFTAEHEGDTFVMTYGVSDDASWRGKTLRKFAEFMNGQGYQVSPEALGWEAGSEGCDDQYQ